MQMNPCRVIGLSLVSNRQETVAFTLQSSPALRLKPALPNTPAKSFANFGTVIAVNYSIHTVDARLLAPTENKSPMPYARTLCNLIKVDQFHASPSPFWW